MTRYLIQRFLIMLIMLAALSIIVFITIELPPGDYADRRALDLRSQGVSSNASRFDCHAPPIWPGSSMVSALRYVDHEYRLAWQLWRFVWIAPPCCRCNWRAGGSDRPVGHRHHYFDLWFAIPIGIYSAIRQYSIGDYAATLIGYFGMATPSFMLALILLYLVLWCSIIVLVAFSLQHMQMPPGVGLSL